MREPCEALGLSAVARQDRPTPKALAAKMGGKERWLEGVGEALGCQVGRGLAPSALGQSTKVGLSPDQPSVKLPVPLKGQHPPLQAPNLGGMSPGQKAKGPAPLPSARLG